MTINHRNGFTLIEVLITVVIIAVLSAVAIPAYNGYIRTAKLSEAHNNIAALKLAEEEYYLENNAYFEGNNYTDLESYGLWTRTPGQNGTYNFDYAVTLSSGYTITATGIADMAGVPDIVSSKY